METQVILESEDGIVNNNTQKNNESQSAFSGGMLRSGEEVKGFIVDRLLTASGGEAEIYLCVKDGKNFVLKYYYTKKPNVDVEEKLKSFSHQNVISILDFGEYKDRFFLILEYAKGGALDDKLPDGTFIYIPLNDDDAKQVVCESLNAFEACHNAGIIHRDIKPGNLFYKNYETLPGGMQKGSHLLIGDFGIASVFDVDAGMSKHMTETGARTEGYAAPEAYSGVIGKEYDYYSLGITLWALLTGMEPFINEKGQAMYTGHITLNAIQGKTIENLLSRSPQMSAFMQKLIRGLLTVRHDKRWKFDEVTRHLAGENVELFTEVQTLPLVEIGGEKCSSYQEIARAIINHPEEGKKFVFKNGLLNYLADIDQKLMDRMLELIDRYSAEKREDEGAIFIAFSLCPNLAFPLEHGLSISSLEEMFTVLNTDPEAILPYLRDTRRGFYAYLEVSGLGEHGKKVKDIVNITAGNIRAVSRIIVTFQGNVINPFQDGVNDRCQLNSFEDLYNLPGYMKERAMIFIERNYGLLPAWIENITGQSLDPWFTLLSQQKERVALWGAWDYFILFMNGLESYDKLQKNGDFYYYEKNKVKGFFRITEKTDHAQMLYGVEADGNRLTLKNPNGSTAFNGMYALNLAQGYDKNGVSTLQFLDTEGRMSVFDGSLLYYFNINSGEKEPRFELKDSEINLLAGFGGAVSISELALSLKEKNNYADMNRLIDVFRQKIKEAKNYKTERDILLLIEKENMEGLPRSYDFYLSEIGITHYIEKNYRFALRFFEQALELNPSGLNLYDHSFNFDYARSLYFMESTEDYNTAIGYFDKAIKITPEKPQPLAWKGYCFEKIGGYNEAIACLGMALDTKSLANEEKCHVFTVRAKCYNALGMNDKANKDSAEADRLMKLPKTAGNDYLFAVN